MLDHSDSLPRTLIIGLSGPSSSGKTTLARLLRSIFNIEASSETSGTGIKLFILHEDDFYKSDSDIPIRQITHPVSKEPPRAVQDWDCVESLDLPLLDRTIRHVHRYGCPPPDMVSKEDQNSVGDVGISNEQIISLKEATKAWVKTNVTATATAASDGEEKGQQPRQITICILDGFLLFPPPPELLPAPESLPPTTMASSVSANRSSTLLSGDIDKISPTSAPLLSSLHKTLTATLSLKLFLPTTKHHTLTRRAQRTGYVTMEGFWTDPPGYVEDIVWPNYTRDHAWMFASVQDVDAGHVDRNSEWLAKEKIVVGPAPGHPLLDKGDMGGDEREEKDADEKKKASMIRLLDWGVEVVKSLVEKALPTLA